LCIINAAYTYNAQLLQKLNEVFPHIRLSVVDSNSLTHNFEYLTLDEQDEVSAFLELADEVLQSFKCSVEIRKFSPGELPALYNASSEAQFKRSIETAKDVADSFWSSVLDEVETGMDDDSSARLCFNYRNPVIYKITRMREEALLKLSVQMLYIQVVLLSHRPLNSKEMALLNEGLLGFIEWGADAFEGWIQ
jgi:molecular chaperone HtpG